MTYRVGLFFEAKTNGPDCAEVLLARVPAVKELIVYNEEWYEVRAAAQSLGKFAAFVSLRLTRNVPSTLLLAKLKLEKPPCVCPVCKAGPDQDCDAGLHS